MSSSRTSLSADERAEILILCTREWPIAFGAHKWLFSVWLSAFFRIDSQKRASRHGSPIAEHWPTFAGLIRLSENAARASSAHVSKQHGGKVFLFFGIH
jgi:hypothetical protein